MKHIVDNAPRHRSVLHALDRRISLRAVISAFPIAFLLHDSEEVLTMERFAREHLGFISGALGNVAQVTTPQVALAVLILFALCYLVAFYAARALRPGPAMNVFSAVVAVLFVNVWTHVGQAALFRGYVPGVITAVLVSLPYSLYAFHRLVAERLITRRGLLIALVVGVLLIGPGALAALLIGRLLAGW